MRCGAGLALSCLHSRGRRRGCRLGRRCPARLSVKCAGTSPFFLVWLVGLRGEAPLWGTELADLLYGVEREPV